MSAEHFHPIANIWPLLDEAELAELADDIRANGLLVPIWRHRDGRIIDGRNRWLACQRIGIDPRSDTYTGPDGPALVAFVVGLNEKRRHLSTGQRAMVAAKIANLGHGGDRSKTPIGALTQDEAARLLNVGTRSVDRASAVQREGAPELIDAVEHDRIAVSVAATIAAEPVETQRQIILSCDPKAIRAAPVEIVRQRQAERAAANTDLATRQPIMPVVGYRVIVIDPPWPAGWMSRAMCRPDQIGFDYPTMSLDEIAEFKLPAADDCHLWCWATQRFVPMALDIIKGWGFRYVCQFVWYKRGGFQPIGLPQYNVEFALYARRGAPTFVSTKAFSCGFTGARREHSRKPDQFYDMVRRVTAGPRIDIFSREPRDGFDQYGNETDKFGGAASRSV
jgi:N6-adenosine-specific RNA methylase IME4